MNESSKTIGFVSTAAVLVAIAAGSYYTSLPKAGKDFGLIGQPFFEEFTSSENAASLDVAAIDEDSLKLQQFSIRNENGLWRIPSHHDYPAEAAARLATTATSVMGLDRESLAGRLVSEHPRLGVVDPLGEEIEDPESVGKRLTLKDADGEVLVDYIIGNEAGEVSTSAAGQPFQNGSKASNYYYVRRADEQQTYKVALDVDLSTKFSDWIDPDLLRIESSQLARINIDNYSLSEERNNPLGQVQALLKVQGDVLDLNRPISSEPWQLKDLDPANEEIEASRINEIIGVLSGLKIAGVRPKFKYKNHLLLTSDLKLNQQPEFKEDPRGFSTAINQLQSELERNGFSLAGTAEQLDLVSQNGQMQVGTNQGVLYSLQIGKEVEGEESAIEIGGGDEATNAEAGDSKSENTDSEPAEKTDGADSSEASDETSKESKNRFLMVRVSFDESLIGERPVAPMPVVEPVAPEGYTAPPEKTPAEKAAALEAAAAKAAAKEGEGDAAPVPNQESDRDPAFVKHDEAVLEYESMKVQNELALSRHEVDVRAFETKIEEGQKLVDELNERFGDWYYVITADNLKVLQSNRADLVKAIEKPPGEEDAAERGAISSIPNISFPESDLGEGDSPESGEMKTENNEVDEESVKEGDVESTKGSSEGGGTDDSDNNQNEEKTGSSNSAEEKEPSSIE